MWHREPLMKMSFLPHSGLLPSKPQQSGNQTCSGQVFCCRKQGGRTTCQSLFHVSLVDKTLMKMEDIVPTFLCWTHSRRERGSSWIGWPLCAHSISLPCLVSLITNQHGFVACRISTWFVSKGIRLVFQTKEYLRKWLIILKGRLGLALQILLH